MPRGRKKSQSLGSSVRLAREGSEESSSAEDAPKVKDSRLSPPPPVIGAVSAASPPILRDHITDYYLMASASASPSAATCTAQQRHDEVDRERSPSPPVLVPQVPFDAVTVKPLSAPDSSTTSSDSADHASDRSEGDSGKENEEDPHDVSRAKSDGVGDGRNKLTEKQQLEASNRVVTRSRANKMPLLSLSTRLNPDPQRSTPPSSPSKTPPQGPPSEPKSPPTPHKITLLGGSRGEGPSGPAASALQKLKISLTPKNKKKEQQSVHGQDEQPDSATKGPKKRPTPSTPTSNRSAAKPRTKSDKLAAAAASSHKVTEYFPIRRSSRRPKKVLEREHQADIEHHLLSGNDSALDIGVRSFAEKGRGVVALRPYSKGEFVVEYAGDLIDVGVAKEREAKYSMDLATGCYMYYFKHKGKQYCIDATTESGRLGRLVNHSRQHPNLQTKVITLKEWPRLILVALKDINEGEELLYDYGDRSRESLRAHPWLAL